MAAAIIINSKCQRPGVCNAAESLLVHADLAPTFLPAVAAQLQERNVELRGCERTRRWLPEITPAGDEDFRKEYLDLILSVKVVDDVSAAIAHVNGYGSHHT
ncbi:MAG: gamma-glutamyl-phosphate reductase, partial [Planctomycetaceae bacterium]